MFPFYGFDATDGIALENCRRRFNALDDVRQNLRHIQRIAKGNVPCDCLCTDLGGIVCGEISPLPRDREKPAALKAGAKSVAPLQNV